MAVLIEALNVLIPVAVLDRRFPGGASAYRDRSPNATFCADGELTRIGFMTPRDTQLFTGALQRLGFEFLDDKGSAVDFVVVDQNTGPTSPCDWLEFGVGNTMSAAWLRGSSPPGQVFCPDGWEPRETPLTFVPNEELDRMKFLGRSGPSDRYLDREAGHETYIGSPFRDGRVPFEDLPNAALPAESH